MFFIHRYWTGDSPLPVSSALSGRIASNWGELIDWTDESLPDEILEIVAEHEGKAPENVRAKQRGNIVRYALLRQFGGLWIDHDLIMLQEPNWTQTWVGWDGKGICSALMMFQQGDSRLTLALDSITTANTALESSGEKMLDGIWESVPRVPLAFDFLGNRLGQPLVLHLWGSRA